MAEEKKKELKPIAKGHVKEKGLGEKAAEAILSEDTKTVGSYILWDVIIPSVKNTIADMVIGGIEMVLFGSSRGSRRSKSGSRVSYSGYYDSKFDRDEPRGYRDRRNQYSYDDILLDDRGEAEEVVSTMEDLVRRYGEASVADLCSLVGVNSKHTDQKWGWTDPRDFSYRRSGRGYILDFAKPEYLG